MNENVIRLIDRRPGFAAESRADLISWLRSWVDGIEADDNVRSVILVVETGDGDLWQVAQSLTDQDRTRVIGLLTTVSHQMLDGCAKHPSLA